MSIWSTPVSPRQVTSDVMVRQGEVRVRGEVVEMAVAEALGLYPDRNDTGRPRRHTASLLHLPPPPVPPPPPPPPEDADQEPEVGG
jgi:hypothetical protein